MLLYYNYTRYILRKRAVEKKNLIFLIVGRKWAIPVHSNRMPVDRCTCIMRINLSECPTKRSSRERFVDMK
jgi:hypothetical protein